jgi:hypothetical protein
MTWQPGTLWSCTVDGKPYVFEGAVGGQVKGLDRTSCFVLIPESVYINRIINFRVFPTKDQETRSDEAIFASGDFSAEIEGANFELEISTDSIYLVAPKKGGAWMVRAIVRHIPKDINLTDLKKLVASDRRYKIVFLRDMNYVTATQAE